MGTSERKLSFGNKLDTPDAAWWVEGGEQVSIKDGKLFVQADAAARGPGWFCTVWHQTLLPENYEFHAQARVESSRTAANNINLFLNYSDPAGVALYETRASRATGAYDLYHSMNGYIVTFLNDTESEGGKNADGSTKARVRLRRCPGFELLDEAYAGHCRAGVTYNLSFTKRGGALGFSVDGAELVSACDARPHGAGLLGLRTFRTNLWWDNLWVQAV